MGYAGAGQGICPRRQPRLWVWPQVPEWGHLWAGHGGGALGGKCLTWHRAQDGSPEHPCELSTFPVCHRGHRGAHWPWANG